MPMLKFYASLVFCLTAAAPLSRAATVWTGPLKNFTESATTPSDTVLAGKVVLTRGINNVLYNTAAGESSAGASSPLDTEWAFGALNHFATLSYQSLASLRDGDLAARILNQQMVVHIKSADTYLSVKFTAWGQHGAGGFAYTRSTPAVVVTPAISITSPAAGSVFPSPATVELSSDATVAGGTVTNVQYFAGNVSLGSAGLSPFHLTGIIPNAGGYDLTAVATAAGISATSGVVHITVVAPVEVSLSAPAVSNGLFSFSYTASPGLRYVVERSSDLVGWSPVSTNVPSSSPALFSDALDLNGPRFYRVGRTANP